MAKYGIEFVGRGGGENRRFVSWTIPIHSSDAIFLFWSLERNSVPGILIVIAAGFQELFLARLEKLLLAQQVCQIVIAPGCHRVPILGS